MFRLTTLIASGLLSLVMAAGALAQNTDVYVIHGIRGQDIGQAPALPVDVAVDGSCTLQGFQFGDVAGPLSLAAGTYQIDISLADAANPCSNPPVISAAVSVGTGRDITIIAHLDDLGNPTASVFSNDIRATGFMRNRVALHHTAAAPAVDVEIAGAWHRRAKLASVMNGQAGQDIFLFNAIDVRVLAAGTATLVIGPATLTTPANKLTNVYVVGSFTNNTLTVLTHTIDTL